MFEKTFRVLKEIKKRKNANKERIKEQQRELKDLLPFQAKMAQTLKVINMIVDKTPDIECITVETDPSSESLVNDYMTNELNDYIVKKHEDNAQLFDIKLKELDI